MIKITKLIHKIHITRWNSIPIVKPEIKKITANNQRPPRRLYMLEHLAKKIPAFFFRGVWIHCEMIIRYEIYWLFEHGIKLDTPIPDFKKKEY